MAICTVGGFISPLVIEGIGFLTSRETVELGFSVRYHHFVNHEKLNKPYHSRKNGCLHAVFIIFSNIIYGCSWNHFSTRNVSSCYSNSSCFIVHTSITHKHGFHTSLAHITCEMALAMRKILRY